MSQLMQKCRLHFFTENLLIVFGQVPKVFQEQNNLRRQRNVPFLIILPITARCARDF